MKENKYAKQWLDPRWQKRRLEIMQRDDFSCCDCCGDDKTLNVHHIYYTRGADVWDYPDHALVTLCNDCHEAEHAVSEASDRALIDALKRSGIRSSEIGSIAFSIDQLLGHVGHEKAARIIRIMDFFIFRPVISEANFLEIEALYKKIKPKGFFGGES